MTVRSERTRNAIKDALLALLEISDLNEITMSELARSAIISRSSLYAHYSNVRGVFEDAVADFGSELRPLTSQLRCGDCISESDAPNRPFCVALRDAGKYKAMVREPSFLPTLLNIVDERMLVEASTYPLDEGMDLARKRALYKFQMSGCYTVALDTHPDEDWEAIQRMLDAYIRGGVSATRGNQGR